MASEEQTQDKKPAGERARRVKSTFLLALIGFAAINAYLSFCTPIEFDRYKFPYRNWAWWAMNDLRNSPDVHNVTLLGSSLVVSAVAGCDANYVNKSLDLTSYHKAVYLDHKLRTRFGGSFNTYNLSLPGMMPSDAYLALRAMVNGAHRPEVVIYGIAPRDFMDSELSSPVDTDPFRYFRRLVHLDDVSNALFRSPLAKLNFFLERNFYLYEYALDFQLAFKDGATRFLSWAVPQPYNNPSFTWWDRVRLLPGYMIAELHPKAVMTIPIDEKTAASRYTDNTSEYERRYRSPDPLTYRTQVYFMKKLAAFCYKERIELIVVNMPITFYNASMLRPGIYARWVEAMRRLCFENYVTFYDLCEFNRYQLSDFYDSVHMNAFGGRKLFDRLVDRLSADRHASAAMALAGKELERIFLANSNRNVTH